MPFGKTSPQSLFVNDTAAKVSQIMSVDSHSKLNIFTPPKRPENAERIAELTQNNLGTFYTQIRSSTDREKALCQLQAGILEVGLKSPKGAFPIMQRVFERFLERIENNTMPPKPDEAWPSVTVRPPSPEGSVVADTPGVNRG